jgi:hypothetical protein
MSLRRCVVVSFSFVTFFQPAQQDPVHFEHGRVPPKAHPLPNVVMEAKSCILKEPWGVKGFDREGNVISSFQ